MEIEIDRKDMVIIVNLHATDIIWENDSIGHYDYGDATYYDHQSDYAVVEEFTWNKEYYTTEENQIIKEYISENFSKLSSKYCDGFEQDTYEIND